MLRNALSRSYRASLAASKRDVNAKLFSRGLRSSSIDFSIEIKMPSLSPTMTEGTIVKWSKKEGEAIGAGDIVCEIQTDKAVVSMDMDDDCVLAKIFHGEDSGPLPVGALIGIAAEEGEDWKEISKSASSETVQVSEEAPSQAGPTGGSTPGVEVKMPALSPTMTEGTIVEWKKREGDVINAGDVLVDIQTDKAIVSMEIDDDGILAKILVPEGTSGVEIGKLIALTVEEGQDWQDVAIPAVESSTTSSVSKQPPPKEPTSKSGDQVSDFKVEFLPRTGPATNLLMAKYGIDDPKIITPSGPKGIVKADVLDYIEKHNLVPLELKVPTEKKSFGTTKPVTQPLIKPSSGYTDHPLSSMRSVIARRLTESKQTSPHGYSTAKANISAINKLRKEFANSGLKVSVNDFIIKAVGTTLFYVPEMNLNVSNHDFQIMPNIDISVAVATDSGLITPIVKDVPNKSLQQISDDIRDLAGRAKKNKLSLDEFQGGTFTVSNLGMFGITEFTAIINPPQVGILAIGSGIPEIDPATGKVIPVMSSTLSFDRRFVDESMAAQFMATFRRILENPEYMNLGSMPIVRVKVEST